MVFTGDNGQKRTEVLRIEFNKTLFAVIIPILIATWAFVVELLCWYYFDDEHTFDLIEILHLANTTFIPTYIATTTCFLYEFFSVSKHLMKEDAVWEVENESLNARYTAVTIITTLLLVFLYIVLNAKVTMVTQIILAVAQIIYICIFFKVELNEVIHVYKKPIRNVVMNREQKK